MNKTQTGHMKLNVPYSELIFLQEIGAGGFSRVHIGEWQRTTVALKVSTSSTSEFYREATLMVYVFSFDICHICINASCSNMRPHPNVVQILGLSTDGPFPALILEYCSGGSLDKLLKDKEKEVTDAYRLRIISGVSKGMYHLHKANIVHRDLAARNILLSGDGEPKVSVSTKQLKLSELEEFWRLIGASVGLWLESSAQRNTCRHHQVQHRSYSLDGPRVTEL